MELYTTSDELAKLRGNNHGALFSSIVPGTNVVVRFSDNMKVKPYNSYDEAMYAVDVMGFENMKGMLLMDNYVGITYPLGNAGAYAFFLYPEAESYLEEVVENGKGCSA